MLALSIQLKQSVQHLTVVQTNGKILQSEPGKMRYMMLGTRASSGDASASVSDDVDVCLINLTEASLLCTLTAVYLPICSV